MLVIWPLAQPSILLRVESGKKERYGRWRSPSLCTESRFVQSVASHWRHLRTTRRNQSHLRATPDGGITHCVVVMSKPYASVCAPQIPPAPLIPGSLALTYPRPLRLLGLLDP